MGEPFADISSHQELPGAHVDIGGYAGAGHRRILLKATEGARYVNPWFSPWWRAAGAAGLARGAYHFARPSRSAAAVEAEHFAAAVRQAGGLGSRDWVCLDAEDPEDMTPAAGRHAADFCHHMAVLGFTRGVIYSGTWYLGPVGLEAGMLPPGWRQLHIANYNARLADGGVPLPPGWERQHMVARQYTDGARTAGIPGASDANRVVREWLPTTAPEEDPVTEQDRADIAARVLAALRDEIFASIPPIRQPPKAGLVIGATYNKVGDVQSRLAGLEAGQAAIMAALGIITHQPIAAAQQAPVELDIVVPGGEETPAGG